MTGQAATKSGTTLNVMSMDSPVMNKLRETLCISSNSGKTSPIILINCNINNHNTSTVDKRPIINVGCGQGAVNTFGDIQSLVGTITGDDAPSVSNVIK